MSDAAPKPWVKALRIKSTPWRVLVGLWGHGSYKADGPAFVWVNRRKLADEIGLPLGTLRNGLDALAAAGWIARDGGGWRLAWMTPYAFTRPADGPTRPADGPARPQADPARGEADPARPQADPRPARGPHELAVNFQSPSNHLADDASARLACTCDIDQTGHVPWRVLDPECLAHRDIKPDTPDPEEHTHGDTQAHAQPVSTSDPDPGGDGTRGRGGALRGAPSDHAPPTHGEAQPQVHGADPGAGALPQHGGPAELDLHNPPRELPDHVLAVHARASGRVGLGSPPLDMPDRRHIAGPVAGARSLGFGRLSPELVAAVAAAGDVWGVQLGHQRFEVLVRECVDDLGLRPEELTRGLVGWETMDRAKRPPRSAWLYQRNRRAFKAAAGLEAPAAKRGGPMFAMDGGLR